MLHLGSPRRRRNQHLTMAKKKVIDFLLISLQLHFCLLHLVFTYRSSLFLASSHTITCPHLLFKYLHNKSLHLSSSIPHFVNLVLCVQILLFHLAPMVLFHLNNLFLLLLNSPVVDHNLVVSSVRLLLICCDLT